MNLLRGNRTLKAERPKLAGQLNTSSHIFGQNPRKQKLTESPGTNISKEKGVGGLVSTDPAGATRKPGGMTQHSAPYKHQAVQYPIGVGGPGFDEIADEGT